MGIFDKCMAFLRRVWHAWRQARALRVLGRSLELADRLAQTNVVLPPGDRAVALNLACEVARRAVGRVTALRR